MSQDMPIRCRCGQFEAVAEGVSEKTGNHVVCYCRDCQSFAHVLGRPDETLDENGGSDIFQMSPAKFRITRGEEHLACLRLTPDGLLRWYASCCNTPVGNTLFKPGLPFVGLISDCWKFEGGKAQLTGRIMGRGSRKSARGRIDYDPESELGSTAIVLRFARFMLRWRLAGAHRASAFFEPGSGKPSREPRVLSEDELQAVIEAREAWRTA